ncbi:MAG: Spy/CpxP family protein refolding chaperone [Elusimicrobia bacterium]|nr:Spy/CpxP family protein refolding chaperone [Candidatus Liberimonas magnetica]
MKKVIIVMLALVLLMPIISLAEMQSEQAEKTVMRNQAMTGHPNLLKYMKELGLTEAQIANIKELRIGLDKSMIKIQADMKAVKIDLKGIYGQRAIDFNAAREKILQLSKIQSDLALEMINTFEKSYNILTAEQKDLLSKILSQPKPAVMNEAKEEKK